jgi:TonB family protein
MSRKGRKIQKDLVCDEEAPSVVSAPDLDAQEKRLVAFEVRNAELTCALIQSPSKVNPLDLEATLRESIIPITQGLTSEKLKKLIPNPENCFVLTTEESYPQVMFVKKAGFDVMTIERASAIYYAHKQESDRKPCLVLSTEADRTSCSLIVNGGVVAKQQDSRDLSHAGIWRNYVESHQNLARTIGFYSARDPTFEPALMETFVSVWKRGKGVTVGKYSFSDEIDMSSSLAAFRKLIGATDPEGNARLVVLSDWAALHCNLGILLRREFRVVGDDNPSRAFAQAFDGLVLFGLNELANRERPQLKLSKKELTLGRIAKGTPARADFKIENTGRGILQARLTPGNSWLKVTPEAVTCGKGRGQAVVVEAETSGLAAGVTHPTQIEIGWSDGINLRENKISVSLEVVEPPVILTVVKKLIPKSKVVLAPAAVTSEAPSERQPEPNVLPERMPESPADQPTAGSIVEMAHEGNSLQVVGRVILVVLLVGAVILFFALWRPNPLAPISGNSTSPKDPSPTSENGNLPVANPSPAAAESNPAAATSSPSPFDVSDPNIMTPSDSPNSQMAVLTFYANTDNVHVSLDGNEVLLGKPYEVKTFRLAPGQHSVKARKAGYTSWEDSFELTQGSSRTLNIVLQMAQTAVAEPTLAPSQIARGYEGRATELFSHQRYDDAISECNSGLSVDPTNESLLRLKGKIEKAKEILAKARDYERSQAVENSSPIPVTTPKPPPDLFEPAVMISKTSIAYPPVAKNARVSGTVVVAVTIDEQGGVVSAKALDGPEMLRGAAVNAAKRCRFRPARQGGKPIASSTSVNFNFVLN